MNAQQLAQIIREQVAAAVAELKTPQAAAAPVVPTDRMARARAAKAAKAGKTTKAATVATAPKPAVNPDAPRVWRRGEDHTSEKGRTYAVFLCSGPDGQQAEWASKIPFDLFAGIIDGSVKGL